MTTSIVARGWLPRALILAALALLLIACGSSDDEDTGSAADTTTPATPAASAASPTASGHDMHDMSGTPMADADMTLMFIDGMIPHHESAIAMAEIALERAEHQEIRDIAQAIIDAQQAEIDQLRAYRDAWYPGAPTTSGMPGMEHMTGMAMSDDELAELRAADPFDRAFIDMMIPHHESAVAMAQAIRETTDRAEIRTMADEIIRTQQQEIDQLRSWHAEWYGE